MIGFTELVDTEQDERPAVLRFRWHEGAIGREALREDWRRLDHGTTVFGRHAWHALAVEHLLPSSTCRYLAIEDDRGPVAIVPMVHAVVNIPPLGRGRALGLGYHPHLEFGDLPLRADADPVEVARTLMRALDGEHGWDLLYWNKVLRQSAAGRIAEAMAGLGALVLDADDCNVLRVDADWNTVHQRLPAKLRSNTRRYQRKLLERGTLEVRSCRADGNAEAAYQDFLKVESSGWKGEAGSSIAQNPDALAFYAALLAEGDAQVRADIRLLLSNGEPIAGALLLSGDGTEHLYKIGYDEAFSGYGTGQVLLQDVIAKACADPALQVFSFVTDQDWHDNWHPEALRSTRLYWIRSPSARALHRFAHAVAARRKRRVGS